MEKLADIQLDKKYEQLYQQDLNIRYHKLYEQPSYNSRQRMYGDFLGNHYPKTREIIQKKMQNYGQDTNNFKFNTSKSNKLDFTSNDNYHFSKRVKTEDKYNKMQRSEFIDNRKERSKELRDFSDKKIN